MQNSIPNKFKTLLSFAGVLLMAVSLIACSPKFDWREVRATDAPFSVLLPAKPASIARDMQLNGINLKMHMTAADAAGLSFAFGYTKVTDASQLEGVVAAMKAGMLKNIHADKILEEDPKNGQIMALGKLENGQQIKLTGRFMSRAGWAYQLVIIGPETAFKPDVADTFLTSLKSN